MDECRTTHKMRKRERTDRKHHVTQTEGWRVTEKHQTGVHRRKMLFITSFVFPHWTHIRLRRISESVRVCSSYCVRAPSLGISELCVWGRRLRWWRCRGLRGSEKPRVIMQFGLVWLLNDPREMKCFQWLTDGWKGSWEGESDESF